MKKVSRLISLLMCAGGILLSLGVARAELINKPHTFAAGNPAKADEVNANFDTVYDQVNKVGAALTVDGANNVGIGIAAPAARLEVVSQPVDFYSPWAGYNLGAIPCEHCVDTCNGDPVSEFTCPDGQGLQCEDLRNSAENGAESRTVQCDKIQPAAGFTGDVNIAGGKLTVDALALPTGAANGSVLTSDGSGNASWQGLPVVPQALVATTVVDNAIITASIAAGSITPDKLADTCVAGEVLVKTATGWVCGTVVTTICGPGDFISCYHSPINTMNVGSCKSGIRPCLESGSGFGTCQGEVLPVTEVCDGVDNDCDGIVDNAPDATAWYPDGDGDGFGDSSVAPTPTCSQPAGMVSNNQDCNDALNSVFHTTGMSQITMLGGVEICGDGVDNDCDGQTDNAGCAAAACNAGEIATNNLCLAQCGYPPEPLCLMQCLDGQVSQPCQSAIVQSGNCLASNACFNGIAVDAQCARTCRPQWEAAFGALPPVCNSGETRPCGSNVGECRQGSESCVGGEWSGVCSGSVAPVAEICGDGLDNDCSGAIDDVRSWYGDSDADGYGDLATEIFTCAQPAGFVDNSNDCDDANASINPGAAEICDGLDNDCDGQIDTSVPGGQVWWADMDGDGFGGSQQSTSGCNQPPPGYTADSSDCYDYDVAVHPGAPEVCNGYDDNCDNQIDETCGPDSDSDGYSDALDCNPYNAMIYPGAVEACGDGIDNDCNGQVDENCTGEQICNDGMDNDGNGLADCADPSCSASCVDSDADGYPDGADCGPFNASIHPGGAEVCGDGVDNNCNGQVDENCIDEQICDDGIDNDGNGLADCADPSCSAFCVDSDGDGYPDAVDCAPTYGSIHPGAPEICSDGIDNNCDGQVDENCGLDSDADGYPDAGDCAPFYAAIHPGAQELCGDGMDNNCDGLVDEGCGQ